MTKIAKRSKKKKDPPVGVDWKEFILEASGWEETSLDTSIKVMALLGIDPLFLAQFVLQQTALYGVSIVESDPLQSTFEMICHLGNVERLADFIYVVDSEACFDLPTYRIRDILDSVEAHDRNGPYHFLRELLLGNDSSVERIEEEEGPYEEEPPSKKSTHNADFWGDEFE